MTMFQLDSTVMELRTMRSATFDVMPTIEVNCLPKPSTVDVIDSNHFFDFEKNKVQSLTLSQLRRTVKENDGEKGVPLHGVYHFSLIEDIVELCAEMGYQAEVFDMFATNNKDKQTPGVSLYPELEAKYGERAVEAHLIRRLYTNIRLRDFDTDELTTNLAISYTQKGIQIGIGRNVIICHNQCMLSPERYVADFSVHDRRGLRLTAAEMVEKVKEWLLGLRDIVAEDDRTIERMKDTILTPAQVMLIIGMLTTVRVQNDTSYKEIKSSTVYPLNQAQICKFTERLLLEQHQKGEITSWSMYNAATDLYKPQSAEQTMILPQNLAFVGFMERNGIISQ